RSRRVRGHDTDGRAPLIHVPRADLCALRVDAPGEKPVPGDESIGTLLLAVLEQQVAAVAMVVAFHDARVDDRVELQRLTRLQPVDADPAELLFRPRARVCRRERRGVGARAHEAPRADALR